MKRPSTSWIGLLVVLSWVLVVSACGDSDGSPGEDDGGSLSRDTAMDSLADYFGAAELKALPCYTDAQYREDLSEDDLERHGRALQAEDFISDYVVKRNLGMPPWIEYGPGDGSRPPAFFDPLGPNLLSRIATIPICIGGEVVEVTGIVTAGDGIRAVAEYTWRPNPDEVTIDLFQALVNEDISAVENLVCQDDAPFLLYDDGWRLAESDFRVACNGALSKLDFPERTTEGGAANPSAADQEPDTDSGQVSETELSPASVSASSELGPTWRAENLIDGDLFTDWQDASLSGQGAVLTFVFDQPVVITRIEVYNLPNDEYFELNHRIRGYRITLGDGDAAITGELADANSRQVIDIDNTGDTVTLVLEVTSTFAGPFTELAIAEILFFGHPAS